MDMEPLFPLDEYVKDVPAVAADMLTQYLGAADSALVVDAFGGLSLTIPRTKNTETYDLLIKELGPDITAKLMARFGGEYLYIPKRDSEKMGERNAKIKELYFKLLKEGKTVSRAQQLCAQEHGLSARHIHRILFP